MLSLNNFCTFSLLDVSHSKEARASHTLSCIRSWILSEEFQNLLASFGFPVSAVQDAGGRNFPEYLKRVAAFADYNWDLRRGKERWAIETNPEINENRMYILTAAEALHMHQEDLTAAAEASRIDYILPLGGARLANFARVEKARALSSLFPDAVFCALSAQRPLSDMEMPFIERYCHRPADEIKTEFDAMHEAIVSLYGPSPYKDQRSDGFGSSIDERKNTAWCLRTYGTDADLFSLSAPSSAPKIRRANTLDTLEHFLQIFRVQAHSSLALVTTSLYIPFQTLALAPLAIERQLDLSFFGVIRSSKDLAFSPPSPAAYLQEIKAAVDVGYLFYKKYFAM